MLNAQWTRITVRIFMPGQHLFRTPMALFLLALCTGCAELETAQQAATDAARKAAAALHRAPVIGMMNRLSGSPKIVVSLTSQRAYFYKGKTSGRRIDRFHRQSRVFDSAGQLSGGLEK